MDNNKTLSISDIRTDLCCGLTRARDIMLNELPHINIGCAGSKKPTWRCRRKDFDAWRVAREEAAGNDRLMEFSRKNM